MPQSRVLIVVESPAGRRYEARDLIGVGQEELGPSLMRSGIAALGVKIRRHIVRRLPNRSRLWLKAVRDTRRHNASITRRDPAASVTLLLPAAPNERLRHLPGGG